MWEYNHSYSNELYHHGIKGMKWGVRRYQNKDGTYTDAGKKRRSQDPETVQKRKDTAKKVAAITVAAVGAVAVSAAAIYVAKNPQAVSNVLKKAGTTTVNALKTGKNKTVDFGKKAVKSSLTKTKAFVKTAPKKAGKAIVDGIKEGTKEALKDAPKKAVKAVITGMTLNAAKRMLDQAVGKEEAARIFQANEKKKIASFWKVNDDRDKDDDDD